METHQLPLVSIITATYNRGHTIERAIKSVLSQTYQNLELIIIDDGSNDNTREVLERFTDPRIRVYFHEHNKGVTAAKNSGLNQIRGDWFTTLDSDDELAKDAIETLMHIPLFVDSTITAMSCNCVDGTTGEFSGKGITKDQFFDVPALMRCKGEFWGITKTNLLGDARFNEGLNGFEATVWYKIDDRAKRYYIHKGLRIYHTEGHDRISRIKYNFGRETKLYENLINETYFLQKTRHYQPKYFYFLCRSGLITMQSAGKSDVAAKYYQLLQPDRSNLLIRMCYKFRIISIMLRKLTALKYLLKPKLFRLIRK
jgi:glycosyltransferase involved in cell wall biosynthesis